MRPASANALVADIGGTNTRLACVRQGHLDLASLRSVANANHASFLAVIADFRASAPCSIDEACIAVAGPVSKGCATLTNLNWRIDADHIASDQSWHQVALLNDLQALGHAISHDRSSPNIRPGRIRDAGNTKIVVNVGTGFNIATVHPTPTGPCVAPSECGHGSLVIANAQELALADFIRQESGFVCLEDILSGRGLERLYGWLSDDPDSHPVSAEFITQMGRDDPIARQALRLFCRVLGDAVGNLALTQLPYGGIYLAGSVLRALAPQLEHHGFFAAFDDKGRFSDLMGHFPMHLMEDDHAALLGCTAFLANRG